MTNFLPKNSFIGFEHLSREIERLTAHANDGYPKHNVVKYSEKEYEIELAVAGFSESEMSISLKDNILTVAGDQVGSNTGAVYLHKGISARKFTKSFRLSEYTQVVGASLQNGILGIKLEVIVPQEKTPKIIKINA